ncbi:MAG TPA: hypothetical protein HPP41_04340 [Deltaproteobacteria bacterium]|nr:hypothetical protein [Deltaproteobacteria bacterium]
MKCPKCSFISFDYNDACPRCNKDLTNERDLMGLPSYKPKPLSMLAPLNAYTTDIPAGMTRNTEVPLTEESMDAVPEKLLISLDDLSDDEPLPIQIETDPTQAEPEQKVGDEIFLDLSLPNSEETESQINDILDPEAVQKIEADIEFDDVSKPTPDLFVKEEAPGEAKEKESIFELELEPLELDLDLEETDEKTS